MRTFSASDELRAAVAQARRESLSVGFVPTMGALHAGHVSLLRRAREECGLVVVSIFVNPMQFAPGEDLARYPRRPEADAEVLATAGADVLYSPDAARFYPPDFSTSVDVSGVSEGGEGAVRPGHFRGVATVLTKLFLQVAPDAAYFGRKDLQQVAVVRRLIRDLDFPIRLVVEDTVREPDGLALSSRNALLPADERSRAAALSRALFAARDRARRGESDARALESDTRRALEAAGLPVDYVEAVDPATMERADTARPGVALAAAVRIAGTRLIDNVVFDSERSRP